MQSFLLKHWSGLLPGKFGRIPLHILKFLLAVLVLLLAVAVYFLQARQSLSLWHLVHLDQEFTAASGLKSFDEYLQLEDRLFVQLDKEIVSKVTGDASTTINRFAKGSKANPKRWPRN
jgi:hypothetical protein